MFLKSLDSAAEDGEKKPSQFDAEVKMGLRNTHSSLLGSIFLEKISSKYKDRDKFYRELRKQVTEFKDVITTPYMMHIIIDILPQV